MFFKSTGISDHDELFGLSNDDHTQYALLSGRGGQTFVDDVSVSGTFSLPELTLGSIPFITVNGVLAEDNSNFFWDDANNRLGIGTTSPSSKLKVTGTTDIVQEIVKANSTQTSNLVEWQDSSGTVLTAIEGNGDLNTTKNIVIPTSTATTGVIYSDDSTLLHTFGPAENIFVGVGAGNLTNTGSYNAGFGEGALNALTTGIFNTALGRLSCTKLTTGSRNIGVGTNALFELTTGNSNTAIGVSALSAITTQSNNVAIGDQALGFSTGIENTVVGAIALINNTTGNYNSAFGAFAANYLKTGIKNTALGRGAMSNLIAGDSCTSVGMNSLFNVQGSNNTALGTLTGNTLISGTNNTFLGFQSDAGSSNLNNATAIGANTIVSQSDALILGNGADVGIGTSAPTSTLSLNGCLGLKIQRNNTTTSIDDSAYQWNGNTNSAAFTYSLPAGIQDRQYKIVNTSTSGNLLTVSPNGSENLLGENNSFNLSDGESLNLGYDIIDGWY